MMLFVTSGKYTLETPGKYVCHGINNLWYDFFFMKCWYLCKVKNRVSIPIALWVRSLFAKVIQLFIELLMCLVIVIRRCMPQKKTWIISMEPYYMTFFDICKTSTCSFCQIKFILLTNLSCMVLPAFVC